MAGVSSIINGRKGGRPKGSKNKSTLEQEAVLKEFKQKVLKSAHLLFQNQMKLAQGCSYLYKTECTGQGKTRKCEYKQVTDPQEIEDYLNGHYDEPNRGAGEDEAYYVITVDKPDNKALDSLLDRTFGKAQQNIDLDDKTSRKEIEELRKKLGTYPGSKT